VRVPGEHGRLLRHLLHEQHLLHQLLLLRRRRRLLHPLLLLLRMHAGDDRPAPIIRVWSGSQRPRSEDEKKTEIKEKKKRK
jgi:hypothetical protein